MGYGKNALKTGAVVAGGSFLVCCAIPIVGPLVGLVVAPVTFLVVEAGALTAYGIYKGGKGIHHGVKSVNHRIHERRERHREHHRNHHAATHADPEGIPIAQPAAQSTVSRITIDTAHSSWIANKAPPQPTSITAVGLHQPQAQPSEDETSSSTYTDSDNSSHSTDSDETFSGDSLSLSS